MNNFLVKTTLIIGAILFFGQTFALSDISNHPSKTAINYLVDRGVINGYPDGTYQPEREINRAEFLKILVEAGVDSFDSYKSRYEKKCFLDFSGSEWFAPYICYAKEQGIINGYPDGTFKPANKINLAEASKIIVNTFKVAKGQSGSNWYETYINGLKNKNYLPGTINNAAELVNRGEMAEMIWRVMEKITVTEPITDCQNLEENLPLNINMDQVRETWLAWTNEERQKVGKHSYRHNAQLSRTSTIWSNYQKSQKKMSHMRPGQSEYYDYGIITAWFENLGITFKNIKRTTYSENIGYGYYSCSASDCTYALTTAIRNTFNFFMAEKNDAYQPHYKSIMNDYFNEIGLGIALDGNKYYLTVHYGTKITSNPLPVCN
ncbi:MAG: S-layer homology domain-containing protein [Candidatus Peregrinibacteria bacterium]|nr:S-layer homology domain-containing protein [Candidatus Peregrinibacteria bacterium]